ncbi:MAG: DUF1343 domain-containing protein [Bacteroidota bacterium]
MRKYLCIALVFLVFTSCKAEKKQISSTQTDPIRVPPRLVLGCENINEYWHLLADKKVALVVNQTSIFSNRTHIVDSLVSAEIQVKKIFAPEHGFRGNADAGASISNQIDKKTGLPIISLYGSKFKPTKNDLAGIDIVVFDIQDVGARFYTYISTMYYTMQACAENHIPFVVLDRPNPNGFYVDGPVLDMKYKSFVGIIPIPVVHGCTIGELAQMINEEAWLGDSLKCDLTVAPCKNYTHHMNYSLPVAPSPNLKSDRAIFLYPSICFFEGTEVSVGRGTNNAFQYIGSPYASKSKTSFSFIPQSNAAASNPPFKDQNCYGYDLSLIDNSEDKSYGSINLEYLINMYQSFDVNKSKFFHEDNFFELLAGTDELRQQIKQGLKANEIRASWQEPLQAYKMMRKKYLIYTDFE